MFDFYLHFQSAQIYKKRKNQKNLVCLFFYTQIWIVNATILVCVAFALMYHLNWPTTVGSFIITNIEQFLLSLINTHNTHKRTQETIKKNSISVTELYLFSFFPRPYPTLCSADTFSFLVHKQIQCGACVPDPLTLINVQLFYLIEKLFAKIGFEFKFLDVAEEPAPLMLMCVQKEQQKDGRDISCFGTPIKDLMGQFCQLFLYEIESLSTQQKHPCSQTDVAHIWPTESQAWILGTRQPTGSEL